MYYVICIPFFQAEAALPNVRNKYERLASVIKDMKRSEDQMKADVDAMEEKRAARIEKFEKLRGEAERVLSEKSQELERVKSEGEKQLATLQFLIRYGPLTLFVRLTFMQ